MQDLGECYEDVEFSSMPDELNRKAAELTAGHTQNPGGFWNETRATTLRTLHANYDNTEYVYSVVDVSDLLSSI